MSAPSQVASRVATQTAFMFQPMIFALRTTQALDNPRAPIHQGPMATGSVNLVQGERLHPYYGAPSVAGLAGRLWEQIMADTYNSWTLPFVESEFRSI